MMIPIAFRKACRNPLALNERLLTDPPSENEIEKVCELNEALYKPMIAMLEGMPEHEREVCLTWYEEKIDEMYRKHRGGADIVHEVAS